MIPDRCYCRLCFSQRRILLQYIREPRCENHDRENNWNNYCQKRKINTTYYVDYDKEPEKDSG